MINKKLLMVVLIVIVAIVGIIAFSLINNNDNNINIDNNNDTIAKNNGNVSMNNSKNDSNNKNSYSSKKDNSKSPQNIKNPKPKLISKNEAIKQAKSNLRNAGIEYITVGGAELVKSDGKYYWSVDYIESDGRPGLMYIDAKAK